MARTPNSREKRVFDSEFTRVVEKAGWKVARIYPEQAVISDGKESKTVLIHNLRPGWNTATLAERRVMLQRFVRVAVGLLPDIDKLLLGQVRDRLQPRIGEPLPEISDNPPGRKVIIPGRLEANLVVDYEDSMPYVQDDALKAWGVTFDDLFPIALDNLRKLSSSERWTRYDSMPGVEVYDEVDEYTAARALIIRDLVSPWPRDGVIIGIPSRRFLMVLRLTGADAIKGVDSLLPFVRHSYEKEGWKVFPTPIWFDGIRWEEVPSRWKDGGIQVDLLPRLAGVFDRLKDGSR